MKFLRSSGPENAMCLCMVFPKGMKPYSFLVKRSGMSGVKER